MCTVSSGVFGKWRPEGWGHVHAFDALCNEQTINAPHSPDEGVLALAVLILYIAVIGLFVAHERRKLVLIVQDIESNNATQVFFSPILNSLGHALVQTQTILSTPQFAVEHSRSIDQTVQNLKRIGADLGQVRQLYPSLADSSDRSGSVMML